MTLWPIVSVIIWITSFIYHVRDSQLWNGEDPRFLKASFGRTPRLGKNGMRGNINHVWRTTFTRNKALFVRCLIVSISTNLGSTEANLRNILHRSSANKGGSCADPCGIIHTYADLGLLTFLRIRPNSPHNRFDYLNLLLRCLIIEFRKTRSCFFRPATHSSSSEAFSTGSGEKWTFLLRFILFCFGTNHIPFPSNNGSLMLDKHLLQGCVSRLRMQVWWKSIPRRVLRFSSLSFRRNKTEWRRKTLFFDNCFFSFSLRRCSSNLDKYGLRSQITRHL